MRAYPVHRWFKAFIPGAVILLVFLSINLDRVSASALINSPTPALTETPTALRPPLVEVPFALGPYDHFYFNRPFPANEVSWPEADYRYGGIYENDDVVHTGIDIDVPMSTPVLAPASGTVVWCGFGLFNGGEDPDDPYGLSIAIRHDFSYRSKTLYTIYAHLSRADITVGQVVAAGDQLGLVGDSGNTTGPHLHFEVRLGKNSYFYTRNPELWLAPPEGYGVLAGRVMDTNGLLLRSKYIVVRPADNVKQTWIVDTYGRHAVNSDDYYQENVVLGDLPAGDYEITVEYLGRQYTQAIRINPGQISYFTFQGRKGYSLESPALPETDFLPGVVP